MFRMLELSPYLIVAVFNQVKNNRGISEREIVAHLLKKTGLESERIKESIIKSIKFLLEAKLISVLTGEKKK